jgi:NitT/TauT family transport system substrate-binding protein
MSSAYAIMTVASSPASITTIGLAAPTNIMAFPQELRLCYRYRAEKKTLKETAHQIMRLSALLLTAAVATASNVAHSDAETIRVAVQKTGTFAWELAVIRAHGLDKQANLSIQALELASPEAGRIALRAGGVDIIVSDWLWVSRERSLGANLAFYPYSSALGAVMVPNISPIQTLADLKGRKLAVAGGPLDKSWLLLQASLKRDGTDLKAESSIVYGAPPLLAEKALGGEMDAVLNYWNFCAALEAKGFRRVADIEEILPKLGAKGRTAMIGYVFNKGWGSTHPELMARFIAMIRMAKDILLSSDTEWEKIQPLTGAVDIATLRAYRDRYREGIPRRPVADEEADARVLYRVLATIGGRELVGPAAELDPGTFYHAIPGD